MGGSTSKSTTNAYTQNVVEALSRAIQNCEGNTVINQQVIIKGNYIVVRKLRLVQGMKLSSTCAMSDENMANIQQAVENAIKQNTEAQNVALLGAVSKSDSESSVSIHNEVKAKINRETIQGIINNFNATQTFYLDGNSNIVEDITMEQSMQVLYDQSFKALSELQSVQKLMNASDQTTKATQTNPISEIIGAIGDVISEFGWMWVIIVVVGLGVMAYVLVSGGGLAILFGDDENGDPRINKLTQQKAN